MGEAAVMDVVTTTDQPELWPDVPDNPRIVKAIQQSSFVRTGSLRSGKILGKEPERCRAICLDLLFGRATGLLSDRQIAWRHRISRNDLATVEHIMAERGELEPLNRLINGLLDDVTYLSLLRWKEGLLNGSIHPGQLPIASLAGLDKRAQRDAGLVLGTGRMEVECQESAMQVAWRTLQAARRAAAATQADGTTTKLIDVQSSPSPEPAPATPPATAPAALCAPGAPGPGGGPDAAAGSPSRWDGPKNFGP